MEILKPIFSVFIIIFFTVAWKIFNWLWLNPRKKERILRQRGFKGNPYTFRRLLFGDTKEVEELYAEALAKPIGICDPAAPRILPFVYKTIETYGKQSFMWAGTRPKVLIMDPELIRIVMVKHTAFMKNFKVTNSIVQELVTGVIRFEGDEWTKRRGILNAFFHMERLKQLIPIFQTSSNEVLEEWKALVSKNGSYTVDVYPRFQTLTSGVVSKTLFASDYIRDERLFNLLREMATMARQATQIADLPGSKYLPTESNRKTKKISNEIKQSILSLVREKEKALKEGKDFGHNLLQMVLQSELAHGYGDEEVPGHVKAFYFAGNETTANLLVWSMIMLASYPEWQERARKEAFQVFGDRKSDSDGLSQLKVLSMIVNETLRLYPPVVELSRLVEEEIQIGEYTIPADTQLMLPTVIIHRDPEYWGEDANVFKPDRFAEGVLKATKGRPVYFPFGWGPRICIGQNYSLLEAKLVLVDLLRTFTFEISPDYVHAPHVVFTLQPQFGAQIIFRSLK